MPLIDFIRHSFPHAYWSAGFIACLFCVMTLSTVLFMITRWKAWLVCFLSAAVYLLPFCNHAQW